MQTGRAVALRRRMHVHRKYEGRHSHRDKYDKHDGYERR